MNNMLEPGLHYLLSTPDEDRKAFIESDPPFIKSGDVKEIIAAIDHLRLIEDRNRLRHLAIIGQPGTGLTYLAKYYAKKYPVDTDSMNESTLAPVIYVDAGPTPDSLMIETLDALRSPSSSYWTPKMELRTLTTQLSQAGTKVILINNSEELFDETDERQPFTKTLLYLTEKTPIRLVLFGDSKTKDAIERVPKLGQRFTFRHKYLWQDDDDWKDLLLGFEGILPLKKESKLDGEDIASILHEHTGGRIGTLHDLLREAAVDAIDTGTEQITFERLKELQGL